LVCALYGIVKGGGQTDGPFENAEKSLKRLYARHSDEFTPEMTALVKLPTEGGEQEVRIFSPRGCYALAMFAGMGHLLIGNVDFGLRGNLRVGSIPAVIVGAMLSARLPHALLRGALAVVLLSIGLKLWWSVGG
jgi:hypothetical protein